MANEKAQLNTDFLRELKANNCSHNKNYTCVNAVGTTVADLGVWEKALTTSEMVAWSTCR